MVTAAVASLAAGNRCAGPVAQQVVGPRLGQPDFSRPAHHLAYVRVWARQRKLLESLRSRVEANQRVSAPFAEPDDVSVVDEYCIRMGIGTRQFPFAPPMRRRVEHPHLS